MIKQYIGQFNAVSLSHQLLKERIKPGHIVVDATCGNGNDTVFLAKSVTDKGYVYAFDIQTQAIEATKTRLMQNNIQNVSVVLDGHEHALNYIDGKINGAVFNLGYLPACKSKLTTKPKTSIQAITKLLSVLTPDGFICITAYVAHPGGRREYRAILRFLAKKRNSAWEVWVFDKQKKRNASPKVLIVQKPVDF